MSKAKRATHVEFQLSRPLTWAEREAFQALVDNGEILGAKFTQSGERVAVFAHEDSRILGQYVHDVLSTLFVNVYLRAIRTVYPRVKV